MEKERYINGIAQDCQRTVEFRKGCVRRVEECQLQVFNGGAPLAESFEHQPQTQLCLSRPRKGRPAIEQLLQSLDRPTHPKSIPFHLSNVQEYASSIAITHRLIILYIQMSRLVIPHFKNPLTGPQELPPDATIHNTCRGEIVAI